MFRKILVPLDGSTFAEHALPLALAIARQSGAAIQLARVHAPSTAIFLGSEVPADLSVETALRDQQYLDLMKQTLTPTTSGPVTATLLNGIPIGDLLHEQACRSGADLIVMTTHGRGPLSRLWLGSVADWLIRHTDVPVLLVRPQEGAPHFTSAPAVPRVLIPLDGTEVAEQILEPAIALGTLLGADFTLLRVITPMLRGNCHLATPETHGEALIKQLQTLQAQCRLDAENYVERVARRLRAQGLRVRTAVVVREHPAVAILEQARAEGAGVIAMATHGRGGLARLLMGSVADKVLRGAEVPLLIRRPVSVPHAAPAKEERGQGQQPKAFDTEEFPGCLHGIAAHHHAAHE
jgi:nucleotide-binding universal stress UspA family protein